MRVISYARGEGGALQQLSVSSTLRAAAPNTLYGVDEYELTIAQDGVVDEAMFVRSDGRDVTHWSLKLHRGAKSRYLVEGTHQGKTLKDVSTSLAGSRPNATTRAPAPSSGSATPSCA